MNQQFNYYSTQSTPSVPAVKKASRLSDANRRIFDANQKQMSQMKEDVQLSRALREEFEDMIEPSYFVRERPLKMDARKDAYFRSGTSQLIRRAKSRNPTIKKNKSAGVFALCQGSTMSFSGLSKHSHIPAEYGGYDLQTYSTKLLSRLSSTEQSLSNDQW